MNNLDKLYQIATNTTPQSSIHNQLLKRNSKQNLMKAQKEVGLSKVSNSDPYLAFTSWFDSTQKYVDNDNRNDYWNLVLQNFPGSSEQANQFLKAHIESKAKGDFYAEEVNLRNLMTKIPDWAIKEYKPRLDFLQSQNSNQNLMKAVNLYKTNLKQRLEKLGEQPLDLDVPEEEHIKDFLKLESLNLLDVARIENGRLVTVNEKGTIVPVFQIEDRKQILSKDKNGNPIPSEMDLIYKVAPDLIANTVKQNLQKSKELSTIGNKTASAAAMRMLESGDLDIPNWGEAMSITSELEPQTVLNSAIRGLIKKDPYKSRDKIIADVMQIENTYPDILSEINLRRNNVPVSKPKSTG